MDPGARYPTEKIPTLLIAGQNDNLVSATGSLNPMHESIPTASQKAYVEFAGADHFVVNNPNLLGNPQTGGR